MSKNLGPEAAVKRAITDLLDAERIPWWRMNASVQILGEGKARRCIRGHAAGTADILAAPRVSNHYPKIKGTDYDGPFNGLEIRGPVFLWIEAKRPHGGKQSDAQKEFQARVEAQGHIYVLATSSDDVLAKLREIGCK